MSQTSTPLNYWICLLSPMKEVNLSVFNQWRIYPFRPIKSDFDEVLVRLLDVTALQGNKSGWFKKTQQSELPQS